MTVQSGETAITGGTMNHHDKQLRTRVFVERLQLMSRRLAVVGLAAVMGVTTTGCDVTNPGPIQDEFLSEAQSHEALVRGAERMTLEGANFVFYTVAVITRALFPGGDTNSHSPRIQGGSLPAQDVDEDWDNVQQARFIAEDALRRFALPNVTAAPATLAQAHLWAGYANRILGENWCEVVFDGGGALPPSDALDRAEANFTSALGAAANTTQQYAAYAGRAQVRVASGDWTGALDDAAQVPPDFVFQVESDPRFEATRSRVGWANADLPYRQFTLHYTFFGEQPDLANLPETLPGTGYYNQTGDPRVAWFEDPDVPFANASLTGFGNVPWSNFSWLDVDTPIHLGTGTEMLLYRAEGLLRASDWVGAMPLINQVRGMYISDNTSLPLDPWVATSLTEAWTHLKTERFIEGLLEGRRLVDLRRWAAESTPGDAPFPEWELLSTLFGDEPTADCYPIPDSERELNTNLPPM